MLVCIDTSLLILSQQDEPREGQEALHAAAKAYESWLTSEEADVMLPTPVLGEFLRGKSATSDARTLQWLHSFAAIYDFDERAALVSAKLRHAYWERNGLPPGLDWQVLKVDMMISAIAVVNHATHIITHNETDFDQILEGTSRDIVVRGVKDGPPGQGALDFR